jgi:hypothetical protein
LTRDEIDAIRSTVSGVHFAKEVAVTDETSRALLYCAEALLRDIDRIHPDGLRLPYTKGVEDTGLGDEAGLPES